jgi:hypothetical protein
MAWDPFKDSGAVEDFDPFKNGAIPDQPKPTAMRGSGARLKAAPAVEGLPAQSQLARDATNISGLFAQGALDQGVGSLAEGGLRLADTAGRTVLGELEAPDLVAARRGLERAEDTLRAVSRGRMKADPGYEVLRDRARAEIARLTPAQQPALDAIAAKPGLIPAAKKVGEFRQAVREVYPVDKEVQESIPGQVVQGVGQAVGGLPLYLTGLGLPASAAQMFDQGYQDATKSGADLETAAAAGLANMPAAMLEQLGDKFQLGPMVKALRGNAQGGKQIVKSALNAFAGEAGTEALQQAHQNAVAQTLYDKDRKITEGTGTAALVGGLTGATVATGTTALGEGIAALDTRKNLAETAATLAAQQEQLLAGRRAAQMFPVDAQGNVTNELPLPEGMRRLETERGVFHYNPQQITADEIFSASAKGAENRALNLGSTSKPEAEAAAAQNNEPLVTITERTPDGTEVRSAVINQSAAEKTMAEMQAGLTPGNSLVVETPEKTLAGRAPDFLADILNRDAQALAARQAADAKEKTAREQRQRDLDAKKENVGEAMQQGDAVLQDSAATFADVQGALKRVQFYAENNALGITQDQRIAAQRQQAKLAQRLAALEPAEMARRDLENQKRLADDAAALAAQKAQRTQAKQEFKQEVTAGRDATGAIDYTRLSDDDLATRAQAGDKKAEREMMARNDRAGDDRPTLLDVLARVKLPGTDAALGGELKLLTEGMTPQQRRQLIATKETNLDAVAETLRADHGFSQIQTPADVIDFVERALRGEDIRPDRTGEGQVEFATSEPIETPEFQQWFNGSNVVDKNRRPLEVYRGEHGKADGSKVQTRLGSYTFTDSKEVAETYAQEPNNRRMGKAENPRVLTGFLSIKRPIIDNRDDPFVDFTQIVATLGRAQAVRFARLTAEAIENTNNWDENFRRKFASVAELLDKNPAAIEQLYVDAYRLLDLPEFTEAAKAAGFDGAIHVGNGESMDALEYRVFSPEQIRLKSELAGPPNKNAARPAPTTRPVRSREEIGTPRPANNSGPEFATIQDTFDLGGTPVGIDLPNQVRNLTPRWQEKTLAFESSLDKALYYAGGTNSETRDLVAARLAQQTGLTTGQIATLARQLRTRIEPLTRSAATTGTIRVPAQMRSDVAAITGIDFATAATEGSAADETRGQIFETAPAGPQGQPDLPQSAGDSDRNAPAQKTAQGSPRGTGRGLDPQTSFPAIPATPEALRTRSLPEIEAIIRRGGIDRDRAAAALRAYDLRLTQAREAKGAAFTSRPSPIPDEATAERLVAAIDKFDAGGKFVWPAGTERLKNTTMYAAGSAPQIEPTDNATIERELTALLRAFPRLAVLFKLRIGSIPQEFDKAAGEAGYKGQIPSNVEAAVWGQKRLIVIAARAWRDRNNGAALLTHEVAHLFWDTLPTAANTQLRALHAKETGTKTGPLYTEQGFMRGSIQFERDRLPVARVAADPDLPVKEWFAERIAIINKSWAEGRLDRTEASLLRRLAFELRQLWRQIVEAFAIRSNIDPDSELFEAQFRAFILAGADVQIGRNAGTSYAQKKAQFATRPDFATGERPAVPAWPANFPNVVVMTTVPNLYAQGGYQAAKAGDVKAARDVVLTAARENKFFDLQKRFPDAILVPVRALERAGNNRLPGEFADYFGHVTGLRVDKEIVQNNQTGHTGSGSDYRMAHRPSFDGAVIPGQTYIIVDDVVTMGGTLGELRAHIESRGGKVGAITTLAAAQFSAQIALTPKTKLALETKFDQVALREWLQQNDIYSGEFGALTEAEGRWLLAAKTLDAAGDRIAAQRRQGDERGIAGVLRPSAPEAGPGVEFATSAEAAAKNLVTVHNTTARKLRHIAELGGMAVPSLAIVRRDRSKFNGFGDITLVASPDLIDPVASKTNKVFNADAYSPRFPRTQFKVSTTELRAAWKKLSAASERLGNVLSTELDDAEITRNGLKQFEESSAARATFLDSKGITPEIIYRKTEPVSEQLMGFQGNNQELEENPEFRAALIADWKKQFAAYPDLLADVIDENGQPYPGALARAVRRVIDARSRKVDRQDSERAMEKQIETAGLAAEFSQWVKAQFSRVISGQYVEDYNERTGNTRRLPYDLDTIVRLMKGNVRDGEGFNYGVGSIRSTVAQQFKSVAQIKAQRDNIVGAEQFEKIKEEVNKEFSDLVEQLRPFYRFDSNRFGYLDEASTALKELAQYGERKWAENFKDVPAELMQETRSFLAKLSNMPTEYFEAKLQRAVSLNEFTGAVIPEDTPADVRTMLESQGLTLATYPSNDAAARAAAVDQIASQLDVAFATGPDSRETSPDLRTQIRQLDAHLASLENSQEDQADIERLGRRLTAEREKLRRQLETETRAERATASIADLRHPAAVGTPEPGEAWMMVPRMTDDQLRQERMDVGQHLVDNYDPLGRAGRALLNARIDAIRAEEARRAPQPRRDAEGNALVDPIPKTSRRDALIAELKRGREMAGEANRTGNDEALKEGTRLVRLAKERLDEEFPGWETAARPTTAQAPSAAPDATDTQPGAFSANNAAPPPPPAPPIAEAAQPDDAEPSPFTGENEPSEPIRKGKIAEVYGHSSYQPGVFVRTWRKVRDTFVGIRGPIPELPAFPGSALNAADRFIKEKGPQFYNGLREFYRALKSGNDYIQRTAEEQVARITRPLIEAGGKFSADDYAKLQTRQEQARRLRAEGKIVPPGALAEITALQSKMEGNPYVLFNRLVLMLDLKWRHENLKDSRGNPIALPSSLNRTEVNAELARLGQTIQSGPHVALIRTALERHMQLVKDVAADLQSRELIAAEQLANPYYFPHLTLEIKRGDKTEQRELTPTRVRPGTEADFRGYLQDPVGSRKPIETDYVRALYYHLVQVGAHNLKADAIAQHARPYDVMAEVRARAEQLSRTRGESVSWEQAFNEEFEPAGYVRYGTDSRDAFPTIMVDRDKLARRLGRELTSEDLQQQLARLGMDGVRLMPEDLKETLMAGNRETWIVPARVAEALRGIADRETRTTGEIDAAMKWALGKWKAWKLFMPWNHIRYEYGNVVADVEKIFSATPGTFMAMPEAAREIRAFWLGGEPSADLRAALKDGVINAITAQEMGGLVRLRAFKEFETTADKVRNAIKRRGSSALLQPLAAPLGLGDFSSPELSAFREAVFRYANFKHNLGRLRAGERPDYGGAYHRDIDAMQDSKPGANDRAQRQAGQISKATFGDYGDMSVLGQTLRDKLIPFYSWMEVNFKYHANLFRNLRDMVRANEVSKIEAAGKGARAAATFAAGFGARAAGGFVLRLALPYVAVALWNGGLGAVAGAWDEDDEIEKELSEEDRRRFHIILGRNADGTVNIVYGQTALIDIMKWFSGASFMQQAGSYLNGKTDFPTALAEWRDKIVPDFLNNTVGSFGPYAKIPVTLATKKNPFPDVTDMRTVPAYDMRRVIIGQIADDFTADQIERIVSKDYYAARDFGTWAKQLVLQVRQRDPEAWAFYAIKDKAAEFEERMTGTKRESSYDAPDQQVLRNFRRAIYKGDVEKAVQFYQRLLDYGYTADRFKQSIRAQEPLAGLPKENGLRAAFVASLTPDERRLLDRAQSYYTRINSQRGEERGLFPSERSGAAGLQRFQANPQVDRLRQTIERNQQLDDDARRLQAERALQNSLRNTR